MATTGARDYPILGPPSISLVQFTDVLTAAGSPAAPEASGMYAAALAQGVDPGVLLAIFQHESSFGKAGVATTTKSIGNLVWTPASVPYGVQDGRWVKYATYTQAAADASRLLASGLYGRSADYSTAKSFPFRWAPSSDGNAPATYGSALVSAINGWRGLPNPAPAPVSPKAPPAITGGASVPASRTTGQATGGLSVANSLSILAIGAIALLLLLVVVSAAGA